MAVNVRNYLVRELRARMPKGWRISGLQRTLDRPTAAITLVIRQKTIRSMNTGVVQVDFTVAAVTPNQDTAKAELALDDALIDFLMAFDDHPGITYGEATKTVTPIGATEFPSYDIPFTVTSRKKA